MNNNADQEMAGSSQAITSDSQSMGIFQPEPCGSHKKYQPNRQDLLWNTCWGVDKSAMSSEEAAAQGLISFRGRWVTPTTRETLKRQLRAYLGVRQVAALLVISAIWKLAVLIPSVAYMKIPPQETFLYLFMWGVPGAWAAAQIAVASGLYRFSRWAYWPAAVLVVMSMAAALVEGMEGFIYLLVWSVALYCMLRGPSRKLFQKAEAPKVASPEEVVLPQDLQVRYRNDTSSKKEYYTYHAIRLIGMIFTLFGVLSLLVLIGGVQGMVGSYPASDSQELQAKATKMVLSNGVAGTILVLAGIGLIKFKRWAFPLAIGLLAGLFAISLFRLLHIPLLSVEPIATLFPHPALWLYLAPIALLFLIQRTARPIVIREE
jgi:hypothetical protein